MRKSPPSRVAVFIEAPGKLEKIKSMFESLGFHGASYHATKGRLFDLPENVLGVRADNFEPDRVPVNPVHLKRIEEAARSEVLFIMTDDDIEGEVIASDIAAIASDSSDIFRIRLQSLNVESLKSALQSASMIQESVVVGGHSRRVFDRIMGYYTYSHDHSSGKHSSAGHIGRVITPTLSKFSDKPPPAGYLCGEFVGSEGDIWSINVPLTSSEYLRSESLLDTVNNLPHPEVLPTSREVYAEQSRPLTGGEALLSVSDALQLSVEDAASRLQKLYEDGRISYPRTDTFYLSDETANAMNKMAHHFGVKGFDQEFFKKKAQAVNANRRIQAAHEGIVTLDTDIGPFSDLSKLSVDEKIICLISRDLFRSGQKDRVVESVKGCIPINAGSNNDWLSVLGGLSGSASVSSTMTYRRGMNRAHSINEIMRPMGVNVTNLKSGSFCVRRIPDDNRILRLMVENGIGRPSTLPYHSTQISKRFLDSDGRMNNLGRLSLSHASNLCPDLLDAEMARNIEDILHYGEGNIKERVSKALEMTGMSVNEGSTLSDINIGVNRYFDGEDPAL